MAKQSICTKFLGFTNTKPSRIRAVQSGWRGAGGAAVSVTLPYDDALTSEENHTKAAQALAEKLGWRGRFVAASLGSLSRYSYCFAWDDGSGFDLKRTGS